MVAICAFAYFIYTHYWPVLLMPIFICLYRQAYAKHYQLSLGASVRELRLSTTDKLTLILKNDSEISVEIVDKLLIKNNLIIRFKNSHVARETKFKESWPQSLQRLFFVFSLELKAFLTQNYYQIYLSESTQDQAKFRQLLRRIGSIN